MRKILIVFFLIVSSIFAYSQTKQTILEVPNATTPFGLNLPVGSIVYNLAVNRAYTITVAALSTQTLTTATSVYFAQYFNGNRTVKRAGLPAVNAGGSDVFTWLDNYFFPFVPATISCTSATTILEVGTNTNITVNGVTTSNDETVFSGGVLNKISPLPVALVTSFGASLSYTSPYAYAPTVSQTLQFQATQNVGNNGSPSVISSPVKSIFTVYTYLYGVSATDFSTGGNPAYVGLTKLIQVQGNKTVSLTGTNGYIYFAYPASYGSLTNIVDQNGFSVFPSFTQYTANITSSGLTNNYTVSYFIYKLNNTTSPAAWSYQFIY